MAVEARLAVEARAVEDLIKAVEARTAEIIDEERRTEAVIGALRAIFGEDAVKVKEKTGKDELPAEIRTAGYTLVVDLYQDGWYSGIRVELRKYNVRTHIIIKSPREPWELEPPGEGEPKEPRAVIDKAVLDVLRQRLPPGFEPFAHVANRCYYCREPTEIYYGFMDRSIPLYIYVEESFSCACERDP